MHTTVVTELETISGVILIQLIQTAKLLTTISYVSCFPKVNFGEFLEHVQWHSNHNYCAIYIKISKYMKFQTNKNPNIANFKNQLTACYEPGLFMALASTSLL